MLKEVLSLKKYFSFPELLANAKGMRRARASLRGYVTTLSFWALQEIGLGKALEQDGKLSLPAFAASRNLRLSVLESLCRYLNRLGFLKVRGDEIAWTSKGGKFWRQTRDVFRLFHAYEPLFHSLRSQLQGNVTYGEDLFRREEEVARGFSALGEVFLFKLMAGLLKECGFRSFIDLGCAEIELSAFVCRRDPAIRCLGIDLSASVVQQARRKAELLHLEDRIQVLLGDMFDMDRLAAPLEDYDGLTAIDLFHGYFSEGEDKLLGLFKKIKARLPGKKFLISEIALPADSIIPKIAYPLAEHELFHEMSRQKSFREGELESLLTRSGWKIEKKWDFRKIAGRLCLLAG